MEKVKGKKNLIDIGIEFVEKYYYVFFFIVIFVACINLFWKLGSISINSWDEARHGVNAYEMLKNKNFIVSTYDYKVDYYNLKPPLSYWLIILGYKLVGFNALGLRLYSVIAALLTIVIVMLFVKHKNGKLAALISGTIMTTTTQYIMSHGARAGDADSIFVLFFTVAMIAMIMIEENDKWLYLAAFSFSMAFLAKSWHAFAIVAVGGLYLLLTGKIFKIKFKQWILFILSASIFIIIWGLFRYSQDGIKFFSNMVYIDLLSRTSSTLEGHSGNMLYYNDMLKYAYFYWLLIFVAASVGYLAIKGRNFEKGRNTYRMAMFLWIIVPYIAFTIAKTKLPWYIMPLYPPMTICSGAFISNLLKNSNRNIKLQLIMILLMIFSMFTYEKDIMKNLKYPLDVDRTQIAIQKISSMSEYRGVNAYTMCGTYDGPKHWDQNHFLAAELYGDLKPKDGGVEAFMNDDNSKSILVIPKNNNSYNIIRDNKLKTLVETDTNLILTK